MDSILSSAVQIKKKSYKTQDPKDWVNSSVVYRGGSSHFFGIGILRYQICSVSVFFGQYSRCVGKISSFMVPPSKNIYYP